jgi:peptidyl-prolyl cis-trans isomerase-like 4
MKLYNNLLVHSVQKDYIAQIGDPLFGQPSRPDTSVYGLNDKSRRYFADELQPTKFDRKGLVATANNGVNLNAGAFFITLTDKPIESFYQKHTVFG